MKTTFDQYVAGAKAYSIQNQGQRKGQAYMNYLLQVCSGLYHAVPYEIDPYYSDYNLRAFLKYVERKWDVFNID